MLQAQEMLKTWWFTNDYAYFIYNYCYYRSMAGIPSFNGFLSKEKFLEAMIEISHANVFSLDTLGIVFPILAIVGSIFTFVYSIKFIMYIFFGKHQPNALPKKHMKLQY